jgi:flagellar assembly protein FliH
MLAAATPDPEAAARREREAMEAARKAGRELGLEDAAVEIAERVAAVEQRLQAEHDAQTTRLKDAQQRIAALLSSLPEALAGQARDAEALAVEVAYAALVRVLGAKQADGTLLPDLCRAVAEDFGRADSTLLLAESDLALVAGNDFGLPVRADGRLRAGQCVIETPRGQIESGLDVRTEAVRRALLDAYAAHRGAQ